ncbi:MAG: hypothetical protein K2O67_05620, partial [Clostridia bacterium]|nr:hypothetical protein [Clostridia bacterium]
LNDALDNIILRLALASAGDYYRGGEECAEKIIKITQVKAELSDMWARLHGIIKSMSERDIDTLKRYAAMRVGARGDDKREIHRAAVKFTRRAGGIISDGARFDKALGAYRCLIRPDT